MGSEILIKYLWFFTLVHYNVKRWFYYYSKTHYYWTLVLKLTDKEMEAQQRKKRVL